MKVASPAAFAIITAGKFLRADLYAFTLAGGTATYYFTSAQEPITLGSNVYQTGLILNRGPIKQKVGLEVQSTTITATPQPDSSTGVPLIAGLPFLTAAKNKIFDGARLMFTKLFLLDFDDVSPGGISWYQGRVNKVDVDRQMVTFTVRDDTELLNTAGPPNIVQPACSHTLFDTGCTLSPNNFSISGTVIAGSTVTGMLSNLTQPDDYFTLGRLTFTTGANATTPNTTYYIRQYKNAFGTAIPIRPFANVPQAGDKFVILPGCPKTIAACKNTNASIGPPFNNFPHMRATPYVPVPETLYDGGVPKGSSPQLGRQGGNGTVGTPFGSGVGQRGSYKP